MKVQPEPECEWLVEVAIECGLAKSTGFGLSPVTWTEVLSWMQATGRTGLWLSQAVRTISEEYVKFMGEAQNPSCPSPMQDEVIDRTAVKSQLKAFITNKG